MDAGFNMTRETPGWRECSSIEQFLYSLYLCISYTATLWFSVVADDSHSEETVGRFPSVQIAYPMSPVSLSLLRKGARGTVAHVRDDPQTLGDEAQSTVSRRLLELGFIPGEALEVVAETWPGGDPMAVRLGNTLFALRRREAGAVLVAVEGR
jgi:ferrous iron transport protein A